jgi:hypothetical protein
MTTDFQWDLGPDAGDQGGDFPDAGLEGLVPSHLEVLPDSGREVLVLGDVERFKELNHPQGENPFGFMNTCGLVSCEDVLAQFGVTASEGEIVSHAISSQQCQVADSAPQSGCTSVEDQMHVLADAGVPAHTEQGAGLGELAGWISDGHGVIIEVNAGTLWNDPTAVDNGGINHAIVVTGVAVDPQSGEVEGYYVNDSRGQPGDSGRFVSADLMQQAWVTTGGAAVVTDGVHA